MCMDHLGEREMHVVVATTGGGGKEKLRMKTKVQCNSFCS